MNENIFRILGVQTREDCISNMLAYVFNSSRKFQHEFLSKICKSNTDFDKCKAYTRISTGETSIPDIVIVCNSSKKTELIILENKLKADEGKDQTEKYASDETINVLHQKLCSQVKMEDIHPKFIFLTLFPDQKPLSSKFRTVTHKELLSLRGKSSESNLADQLLNHWLDLIELFYKKSQIDEGDIVLEKLQDEDGLDGSYLYFRAFLSKLALPNDLKNEGFFRASQQGRRYYGAIFSKDSWHPSEMEENHGSWTLDPEKVFNIHFEPQFNVLSGIFNIYLHYEVNPYETLTWVRNNIPKTQYEKYISRREKFVQLLIETGIKKWEFGGGSNQIAKVQLDFNNLSVREALNKIEEIFGETSKAIDSILAKL